MFDQPRDYFLDPVHGSSRPDPQVDPETESLLQAFVDEGYVVEVKHPILSPEESPNTCWTVNLFRPDEQMGPGADAPTIRAALEQLRERLA